MESTQFLIAASDHEKVKYAVEHLDPTNYIKSLGKKKKKEKKHNLRMEENGLEGIFYKEQGSRCGLQVNKLFKE